MSARENRDLPRLCISYRRRPHWFSLAADTVQFQPSPIDHAKEHYWESIASKWMRSDALEKHSAQQFNGKWYRVYPGRESWFTARNTCERLGGTLAIIRDQKTQDFLKHFANNRALWIGATNEQTGIWHWIDGSPLKFTAWMKGQPSNFKNHENWLVLGKGGGWFDIDQRSKIVEGFICEWKR